jgi:hypothetical protein
MPKLIKHPSSSAGFKTTAYPLEQPSYGERLTALTLIYLELSLPLQVALRAAEADLGQSTWTTCPSFDAPSLVSDYVLATR